MGGDEHRPALRSYDEFATRRRKRTRRGPEGEFNRSGARSDATLVDESKVTEEALREAALGYLDRQDASAEQVRRVLRRRAFKYSEREALPTIYDRCEAILVRLQESGVIDDARYARVLAESLRRRGGSIPRVRQKLRSRGLSDEHVQAALAALEGQAELSDEASAAEYARKRRLLQRHDLSDPKQREKALAALARQGFSFDVARRVLGL